MSVLRNNLVSSENFPGMDFHFSSAFQPSEKHSQAVNFFSAEVLFSEMKQARSLWIVTVMLYDIP